MENLNRLLLIQYTNDSMVEPYQSAQFGDLDEDGNVIEIFDTDLYKEDRIGLKTLYKNDKISFVTLMSVP